MQTFGDFAATVKTTCSHTLNYFWKAIETEYANANSWLVLVTGTSGVAIEADSGSVSFMANIEFFQ